MSRPGQIVVLNGAPRSGKSSIVAAIQESFDGVWVNLGVDSHMASLSKRHQPGIGLRPGDERLDLEALLPSLYAALYESIAAHSRLGLNVVVDAGHHDGYSRPLCILGDCARRLSGLPALFVGVRCPLDVIMVRRAASDRGHYLEGSAEVPVPKPVSLWQSAVHTPGAYDLEVDTSLLGPQECARVIGDFLKQGISSPSAFERLAYAI